MRPPTDRGECGKLGEEAAVRHLKNEGWTILARNYEALGREVDIVAQNRDYLIFVEVKTRRLDPERETVLTKPAAAVNPEKQRHIIRTARCWLAAHPTKRNCRLDIIEVYLAPGSGSPATVLSIHHIPGAFTA